MQKKIAAHNISIKIFKKKPDIKFEVIHFKNHPMHIIPKKKEHWQEHSILKGKIIIDWYKQLFFMYCDTWSLQDYYHQWQAGLDRIATYNESCIVTGITNVGDIPSLEWWLLYKINGAIHVQYHCLVGSMYTDLVGDSPFTPETCYDFIPPRKIYEDDGEKKQEIIIEE